DDSLNRVLWLLASEPDLQARLKEATWLKLENFSEAIPAEQFEAVLSALAIPRLRPFGIKRLESATQSHLSSAVSKLRSRPDDAFIDKCVAVYEGAWSFDTANTMAKEIITPLVP